MKKLCIGNFHCKATINAILFSPLTQKSKMPAFLNPPDCYREKSVQSVKIRVPFICFIIHKFLCLFHRKPIV